MCCPRLPAASWPRPTPVPLPERTLEAPAARFREDPPDGPCPEPDPELGLEPDFDRALPQDPFPDWASWVAV
jgi:hypothetical protein